MRATITIISLATLAAGIYYAGYSHGSYTADNVLAEVKAELSKQAMENELLAAHQQAAVEDVGSRFDAVRAGPATAVRVQQPACPAGGKVPTAASAAREPASASVESRSGAGLDAPGTFQGISVSVARCEEIASRAVTDAAHILWLQDAYLSLNKE